MGMNCERMVCAALTLAAVVGLSNSGFAQDDDEAQRAARWKGLQHAIFGDRVVTDGNGFIEMGAPFRPLDAAVVPISVTLKGAQVRSLYLVIDENPGPLAGHFVFGPESDPR